MTLQELTHLTQHTRRNPAPSFSNVIPAGAGWYRLSFGKWRRMPDGITHCPDDRWLGDAALARLAGDAMEAVK